MKKTRMKLQLAHTDTRLRVRGLEWPAAEWNASNNFWVLTFSRCASERSAALNACWWAERSRTRAQPGGTKAGANTAGWTVWPQGQKAAAGLTQQTLDWVPGISRTQRHCSQGGTKRTFFWFVLLSFFLSFFLREARAQMTRARSSSVHVSV